MRPALRDLTLSGANPDGMGLVPAVEPGQVGLVSIFPGFLFFSAAIALCAVPLKTRGMQANLPKRSKCLRRGLWMAATLPVLWALVWGLGWALLPMVLKSQGGKIGSEALGRTVTVGNVDFKPWTLELTLRDVAV